MEEKVNKLEEFLKRYTGKSASLLLNRQLEKTGIVDLNRANNLQLMNLTESIVRDILSSGISRSKVLLARSELMGILDIDSKIIGIPTEIDNVRVLPENLDERLEQYYSDSTEYILRQEMARYGIKELGNIDSQIRVKILEGFIEHHFGLCGRSILEDKIDELNVRDICTAPAYKKILLMEYIIQDMLLFYVKPIKGRMIRSELVALLDVDLELAQGPIPHMEEIRGHGFIKTNLFKRYYSFRLRTEFEDILMFLLKREYSTMKVSDMSSVTIDTKNKVIFSVLSNMLGNMTKQVFSMLQTKNEFMKNKFMLMYFKNYLGSIMLNDDAIDVYVRFRDVLALNE